MAQVRSAAAWIIKSFAAIAVALIGTSPLLVHLGDIGLNARGIVAVLGAVAALGAIALIITWATDINLTQVTDIIDLSAQPPDPVTGQLLARITSSAGGRQLYLGGRDSVAQLLDERQRTVAIEHEQLELYATMTPAGQATITLLLDSSRATIADIDAVIDNLQGWVTYNKIRKRFDDRRRPLLAAGAVAVLGIALWLTALGIDVSGSKAAAASATPGTVTVTQGTVGTLTWSPRTNTAASSLRRQLGLGAAACDRATVLVAAGVGDASDPWQATILANQRCVAPANLGSFTVDRRTATFTGLSTVPARSANVTIHESGNHLDPGHWLLVVAALVVAGLIGFLARFSSGRTDPGS